VWGDVLRWPEPLHDMRTAVAVGQELLNEPEETRNASRALVGTRYPMVRSSCANATLAGADPEAGACWSHACATPRQRTWRLTASSLRP
jgi:hypothetical protein